ncbi:unnamed protein product [Rhizoctonia solani]|uniref:ubiquitinyl hydrolase 1 n=1 Tax=Rhizoctonia solani TaxID=456999 RepID=A0A8H3GUJ5_9AGAM|nr:unnamed protein product [Rhizoctonia solani]
MQVRVKLITGEVILIELDDSATVGDLQDALEAKGRPYKNLLRFGKKLHENRDQLLSELGLTEDSEIHAINRKEPEEPAMIKIKVKSILTGRSYEMEFAPTAKVSDVKKELEDRGLIPHGPGYGSSSLVKGRKQLTDKETLDSNGVEDGDELILVLRTTGGGPGGAEAEVEGEVEVDDK